MNTPQKHSKTVVLCGDLFLGVFMMSLFIVVCLQQNQFKKSLVLIADRGLVKRIRVVYSIDIVDLLYCW